MHDQPLAGLAFAAAAAIVPAVAAADPATGTIDYRSKAGAVVVSVTNVYMVKGPDELSGKPIRQLIFTSDDVGATLQHCSSMTCAGGNVMEGMTVDFDVGPRLNYWVAGNGQRVQYSGTVKPDESLKLTADTPGHLAGTLTIDDSAAGGPKVNIRFDAKTIKQFIR